MVRRGFNFNSLKALPKFFAFRNEIDIYTEDKISDKEFYKVLLGRLVSNKVKINDITPLGSKSNVLRAFDEQDINSKRKKIFIIDGDLDLIINTNRKSEKNLVVLDSYCIENYLIDEDAATELIYFSNGKTDKKTISKKLNFDKWLNYNKEVLIKLFINFGILRMFGGGPRIKSASMFLIEVKKQTILNKEEIVKYSLEVKNEIIELLKEKGYENPEEEYDKQFQKLIKLWPIENNTLLRIVSGKDYLIHLLQHRIKYCIGKGKSLFPKQSLKLYLASNCDLSRLEFLKNKLKN